MTKITLKLVVVRTLRSSRGHLMNKVNHLFYYVPGSHSNNKIDVANHGNFLDAIFKMAAIEISEITFSAITQFLESIETRFWCLIPCFHG